MYDEVPGESKAREELWIQVFSGLRVGAGHWDWPPHRPRWHRTVGQRCWLCSGQGVGARLAHLRSALHETQPGKPHTAVSVAFQLIPVLLKGTYRLAKPGHSCFLQPCSYLLAAALPEAEQTLLPRSFEPINAAGSNTQAPKGKCQPSTAALFAHAIHFAGARCGVYSQNITLSRYFLFFPL